MIYLFSLLTYANCEDQPGQSIKVDFEDWRAECQAGVGNCPFLGGIVFGCRSGSPERPREETCEGPENLAQHFQNPDFECECENQVGKVYTFNINTVSVSFIVLNIIKHKYIISS